MNYLRKQWYLFLNKVIPNRKKNLLDKIVAQDKKNGLYDEDCCGNWNDLGECTCYKKISDDK